MKVNRVHHHPLLHLGRSEHANASSPGFVGDGLSEAENEQFSVLPQNSATINYLLAPQKSRSNAAHAVLAQDLAKCSKYVL